MADSPARAVRVWRRAVGHAVASHPTSDVDPDQRALQVTMLLEETQELLSAVADGRLPEIAHEVADVVIVAYGLGDLFGLDVDRAVDEVMRANATKLTGGRPVLRADGKVLKGPRYQPPDMRTVVELTRVFGRSSDLPIPPATALRAPMVMPDG